VSDYQWEVFDKRAVPMTKTPQLTIQSRGTMSMNAACFAMLGGPPAVELLFDRDRKVVGLRPSTAENPIAYPIRPVGAGQKTYVIAATTFTQYYGIPLGLPIRYSVELVNGVLIVDLNKEGRVANSNRARTVAVRSDDGVPLPGSGLVLPERSGDAFKNVGEVLT
jgi:hypothetical protein